jgi:prolyl-tRNA editing enzyme YbaK/EbsC (Cys-tRNA(Pro) deacylase)
VVAAWPEPVERVSSFLRKAGVEARIEEFPAGTPTAADAAAAVGCGLDQIVKSLVLLCDERPVIALVPGDQCVDREKVAQAVDAKTARVASPVEVEHITGFLPGAVAPFPLPNVETVVMERQLLRHPVVWAGAGSSNHMVGLAPAELGRLTRARQMDVISEPAYDSPQQRVS